MDRKAVLKLRRGATSRGTFWAARVNDAFDLAHFNDAFKLVDLDLREKKESISYESALRFANLFKRIHHSIYVNDE